MIFLRARWYALMIVLIPVSVQAGSAEAWKDYQAEKNLTTELLSIGGLVVVGAILLWVLSKAQGLIDKQGEKSKLKKNKKKRT